MAATQDADGIRREMAKIRCDIYEDVEGILHNARVMADWHYYVRRYPWASVAVAAAAGFLLIPRRVEVVGPDAEELVRVARRRGMVIQPREETRARGGLASKLLQFAASMAVRGLMSYAGQQAGRVLGTKATEAEEMPAGAGDGRARM